MKFKIKKEEILGMWLRKNWVLIPNEIIVEGEVVEENLVKCDYNNRTYKLQEKPKIEKIDIQKEVSKCKSGRMDSHFIGLLVSKTNEIISHINES